MGISILQHWMKSLLLFLILAACMPSAFCSSAVQITRDDEIESAVLNLIKPILLQAKLAPKYHNVYLIRSEEINAFVTPEKDGIFINYGLLTYDYQNPEAMLGVIAHECGHIASGHHVTGDQYRNTLKKQQAVFTLLTLTAGAISEDLDIAAVVASKAGDRSLAKLGTFTRMQESAADRKGLTYMKALGIPTKGLIGILEYFAQIDNILSAPEYSYLRTHPLSSERIAYIKKM